VTGWLSGCVSVGLVACSALADRMAAQDPAPTAVQAALKPGTTLRVSVASDGSQGTESSAFTNLSADGTCVAFTSSVRNFRPERDGFERIAFVHELATGRTDPIDIVVDGKQAWTMLAPHLSADGRLVALAASLSDGARERHDELFVFDRHTRVVTRVDPLSQGVKAPVAMGKPVVLADNGSCLLFQTTADFGKGINKAGCYLYDLASGAVEPLPCGAEAMWSLEPSLSADGRILVIQHMDMPHADARPAGTYLIDRDAGTVIPVATTAGGLTTARMGLPRVSGDGRCIAYVAADDASVAGDTNGFSDVFVFDRGAGTVERVSVSSSGEQADESSRTSHDNPISSDGRFIVFQSEAGNLVPGDTNGREDIFVRDRKAGRTVRVSVASDGTQSDGDSSWPSISADGRRVAFTSKAANLVPDDTNGVEDVFVHELNWEIPPAPAPTPSFERRRTSDRGFESVREVSRTADTSVLRVDTDYWGGATGGVVYGWMCLSDLCRERGFPYFVILENHLVRNGTTAAPGNEWELTLGLLREEGQDIAASFPTLVAPGREYRSWPLLAGDQQSSIPAFMGDVFPSELWDIFSSIHFRFRSPDEPANSVRER